jgi:lipoprotein-releasing system ATP-binding protein
VSRAPTSQALLAARGVRKSFPVGDRRLEVLHGVDLELAPGELLGLVGASGAGKSTLLHVLGLLDPPTEGRVVLEGKDAWALPNLERARLRNERIGFVFQFYHLLPELDAVENVILPAMIGRSGFRWRSAAKELRAKAKETLARFGLGERLSHRPAQLSGGEQQRVAIARAMFLDPAVVIADEPTGNLDRATGERVLDLLIQEQEKRGLALLLVTHDERVAHRCGRVIVMEDGRVRPEPAVPEKVPDLEASAARAPRPIA